MTCRENTGSEPYGRRGGPERVLLRRRLGGGNEWALSWGRGGSRDRPEACERPQHGGRRAGDLRAGVPGESQEGPTASRGSQSEAGAGPRCPSAAEDTAAAGLKDLVVQDRPRPCVTVGHPGPTGVRLTARPPGLVVPAASPTSVLGITCGPILTADFGVLTGVHFPPALEFLEAGTLFFLI